MKTSFAKLCLIILTLLALTFGALGVSQAIAAGTPPDSIADVVYGQSGDFTSNGTVNAKSLYYPYRGAVDSSGNLYVSEFGNNRVLYYLAGSTTATRVYGQGGVFNTNTLNKGGISANSLYGPLGIALDSGGNLYVTDGNNNRALYYAGVSTTATAVYGQGDLFYTGVVNKGGVSANSLNYPYGITFDNISGSLYVADFRNNRVLKYADSAKPVVNTFTATSPAASLNIAITAFTASDNISVTGYLITESATPPAANATGWSATAPTTYTVTADGAYTLYPWAKDAVGNVSAVFGTPVSVTVVRPAPVITFGTAPTPIYPGANFTVSATTTNTDSATLTYSAVSGPCTFVSGATFTPTGVGVCKVQAAGVATTHFAAASQTQDVTINAPVVPVITFGAAPTPIYPGPNFTSATTTNTDSATLTYSAVSGPCTWVSDATFTPTGVGVCVVQAAGAATTNFAAASQTQNVTIKAPVPVERIKNGGFELYPSASAIIPTSWVKSTTFGPSDGKSTMFKTGKYSVQILGAADKVKTLTQTLPLKGLMNEKFTFSYWVRANQFPTAGLCQAQVLLYNGKTLLVNGTKTLKCPTGTTYLWKQPKLVFTAPADYTKVVVKFTYSKVGGTVWFDLVSLMK